MIEIDESNVYQTNGFQLHWMYTSLLSFFFLFRCDKILQIYKFIFFVTDLLLQFFLSFFLY